MGKHAVISAGQDVYGNERHKMAPRVRVTERVTGYAQQEKARRLAGPVMHFSGLKPDISDTTRILLSMIAGRKVTDMTETMASWRKESATRHVLTFRSLVGKIVVKKANRKDFNGWEAHYIPAGQNTGPVLVQIAKGSSINHNGEREDACRAAMNLLHVALQNVL
jgi:hypothetical protein